MTAIVHHHRAFGLSWRSDIALPHFAPDPAPPVHADIIVRRCDDPPPRADALGWFRRSTIHADGIRINRDASMLVDMIDGREIIYAPGRDWGEEMPAAFYSTVAALTLAWRGALPLHASAVEVAGHAILVCGGSGAGKSTLVAAMVTAGARFVADDLTIAWPSPGSVIPLIAPGRPAIRLHPDTARWLPTRTLAVDGRDDRGKWLAEPEHRTLAERLSIAAILLPGGTTADGANPVAALEPHLFRPRWMAALPAPAERSTMLAALATLPQIPMPPVAISSRTDFDRVGEQALAGISAAIDPVRES